MAEPVKRTYESPRRRAQAAATRRQILDAAQRLFEAQGYATTTMAAIAREAGVALKTVYVAFDTKSGVLRALWHLLLRGDEADVAVQDRDWYRRVLAEPDPAARLELAAHNSRVVKERAGALLQVIHTGAAVDDDVAELWSRIEADFYENQRAIVQTLADDGALRPELDAGRAADVLWTLNHPDVWHLLVRVRGWTPAQWQSWFAATAAAQLLAPRRARRGAAT
jgi:AcrR family transcriptional regulator